MRPLRPRPYPERYKKNAILPLRRRRCFSQLCDISLAQRGTGAGRAVVERGWRRRWPADLNRRLMHGARRYTMVCQSGRALKPRARL